MKKFLLFTACLFLTVLSLRAQPYIKPHTYTPNSTITNKLGGSAQYEAWQYTRVKNGVIQKLPFRLLKPVGYNLPANANKRYPFVIMLHGKGEAGHDNDFHLLWGGKEHLEAVNNYNVANPALNRKFDGFVMFPQEPFGQWTNNPAFDWPIGQLTTAMEQVFDIVDSLKLKYRIDQDRISLHGLSSGGTGSWAALYHRPDLFAAAVPMSAPGDMSQVGKIVSIPIWLFQGGKDKNPIPYISQQMMKALRDSGAVNTQMTKYTEYPNNDHNVWEDAYKEPDFFPFLLRANKRKITVLGKNPFCVDDKTMLALSAGFYNYQWYRDNVLLPGETANKLRNINVAGKYHVRFQRYQASVAYSYSDTVELTLAPLPSKPLVSANESLILPSPSANKVTLSLPAGNSYLWSNGATTNSIVASQSGVYRVKVRIGDACWSAYSDTMLVRIGAMGTPVPATPTGLSGMAISPVISKIDWVDAATNETGYEIYRATQLNGPYKFIKLVAANSTTYNDSTGTPSTAYYYKVRSVNKVAAAFSNEYAYVETMKDVYPPSIPQDLHLYTLGLTDGKLVLKWNKSKDTYPIKRYAVYSDGVFAGYTTDTTFTYASPVNYGDNMVFQVEAEDYSKNKSGKSNSAILTYTGQGLVGSFYKGFWENIPNFNALTPKLRAWVSTPTVNDDNSNLVAFPNAINDKTLPIGKDSVGVSYQGYINIPKTGNWKFYTSSDDGSRLYIDNNEVVANDGLHGNVEQSGTIDNLSAGWHTIKVNYFEKGGGQALSVSYECAGCNSAVNKTIVPPGNLSIVSGGNKGNPELDVSNYGTLTLTAANTTNKLRTKATISFGSAPRATVKRFELFRIIGTPTSSTIWTKIASIARVNNATSIDYLDTLDSPGVPLKKATTYYYALKIYSDFGTASFHFYAVANSNYKFFTTANTTFAKPAAPTNLVVTGISNNIVKATFTDNTTIESGYELWRSSDNVNFSPVVIGSINKTLLYDSTGTANTLYYYKVRAYNGSDVSNFSTVASTSTLNIPSPPSDLKVDVLGPKHVNLSWVNNSNNMFGIVIYRGTTKNGIYAKVDSIRNPTLTFYQDTSTVLSQKFYYKVKAFNLNPSAFSNIDSSRVFTAVAPTFANWRLPVVQVDNGLREYGTTGFYGAYKANNTKLATALLNKVDFASYSYVKANDTAYVALKLPILDSMPYGGFITYNASMLRTNQPDSVQIVQETFDMPNTTQYDQVYYYLRTTVFISSDGINYTRAASQPYVNPQSDFLQKVDLSTAYAGKWVKISFKLLTSPGVTYNGINLSDIAAFRFLGPNVRHNYFLMLGASVERPYVPMGLRQFRKRLLASDLADKGKDAVIFNWSVPGTQSKYVNDSVNTYMSQHPYASYVIVHQGGNNINSSTIGMRPLSYSVLQNAVGVKNFISSFTSIIQKIQAENKIPLVSRMHFRDYIDNCPNTSSPPAGATWNGPGTYRGRNQENGSLPYNLLIDSLTKVLTPYTYNFAERRSSINYYPITLNRQVILGGDGVHPNSIPNGPIATVGFYSPNVDIMTDYWINYTFRYVYTGKFANPIDYDPDHQTASVDPKCGLAPANKPNLYNLTIAAVKKAEQTKLGSDIWDAKILIEQLGPKTDRIPLLVRLDSLVDFRSPANPSELSVSIINSTTLALNWQINDLLANGFEVWKSNNGGTSYKLAAQLPANSTHTNITGLDGDTVYHFYVRALNGTFKSGWSNVVNERPSSTYFSNANGNLDLLGTWGLNTDGSGATPTSFTLNGQVFIIANRPNETVLNNNLTISGNHTKLIVTQGSKLTVGASANLTSKLEIQGNTVVTFKSPTIPNITSLDSTSTLIFQNSATLANKKYGQLQLTTTGTKAFTEDTVTIVGNMVASSNVLIKGKPTVIKLYGNLTYTDTLPKLEDVSIVLMNTSHTLESKGGVISLGTLTTKDTSTVFFKGNGKLKLGAGANSGLLLGSGTTLDIASGSLYIQGMGTLNKANYDARISSNLGSVYLNTSATDNSHLYPSTSGLIFQNITNYNNGGASLVLHDSLNLTETLKLGAGIFETNDHLVLVSDVYGTARIAKVEAGASLVGNVKWERLVGPFKKQAVYLTATPIKNQTVNTLTKYLSINGFKPGESSTLNTWNEVTNKWESIKDSNSIMVPGKGYRTLIKSKDLVFPDSSGYYEQEGYPVIGNGTNNTAPFVFPLSHASGGYNLLGNPYPCEIDWNSTAWNKASIDNAFYVWDGTNKTYRVYKGTGGTGAPSVSTNGLTNIISAGQGFMVRSVAAGASTMSVSEDAKTNDTEHNYFFRQEDAPPMVRITLRNDVSADQAVVRFYKDASLAYDVDYDAQKYSGTFLNLSTLTGNGNKLTVNSLPYYAAEVSVPLHVQSYGKGTFQLDFTETESFPQETEIYLVDKNTGSYTDVRNTVSYPLDYTTTFDTQSRFELLFRNLPKDQVLAYESDNALMQSVQVYPNPSHGHTMFQVNLKNQSPIQLDVYDDNGKHVFQTTKEGHSGHNKLEWNLEKNMYHSGIYFYKIGVGDSYRSGKIIVE